MDSNTSKERGLLKLCSYKKHTITSLEKDIRDTILLSSQTIGKLGGKQEVLNYRAELGGYEKAWLLTEIRPYTNKRKETFDAHYTVNNKYMGRASSKKPIEYLGWLAVSQKTIHKWEIIDTIDFKLSPIKNRTE